MNPNQNKQTRTELSPVRVCASGTFSETDRIMMQRALELAAMGAGHISPNPMVGSVITVNGHIIGEGWHRCCGQAHAEVNAVNSIPDKLRHLLPEATVYVTLEPCAHYGKTPPCADMLASLNVKRVVIATEDPFSKVAGRGIAKLLDAGIKVETGLFREQARKLNCRFITAHTLHRPWIELKYARSANNYVGGINEEREAYPVTFSTPLTRTLAHRERANCDAIMVGTGTIVADNPSLTLRHWPGKTPVIVVFDSADLPEEFRKRDNIIVLDRSLTLDAAMTRLYEHHGITSILVEGGPRLQQSFINASLYDRLRIETAPFNLTDGVPVPTIDFNNLLLEDSLIIGQNRIDTYTTPLQKQLWQE